MLISINSMSRNPQINLHYIRRDQNNTGVDVEFDELKKLLVEEKLITQARRIAEDIKKLQQLLRRFLLVLFLRLLYLEGEYEVKKANCGASVKAHGFNMGGGYQGITSTSRLNKEQVMNKRCVSRSC